MLSLIVAMSENRVIGRENALPWHLPADLRRFKELTTGHAMIMGRKTFESIGKPLPNRRNIVITSRQDFASQPGVEVARTLPQAIEMAAGDDDQVFLIGGARVFAEALPVADRIYLTLIHAHIEGDTFFPPFESADWRLTREEHRPADERNAHDLSFRQYDRI